MSTLTPSSSLSSPIIQHVPISIPQSELDELKLRLHSTRWPSKEPVTDRTWSQGAPLHKVRELADYWYNKYDWRRCEKLLNDWQQLQTVIDGLTISFYHLRSRHTNALPLLLTHGWPGSILEFRHCVPLLTDPSTTGDAFHVVIPSLPGYGWSEQPSVVGWDATRTANAWTVLMQRLGYKQWVAQGGDWGAMVTTRLGQLEPAGLLAIHINSLFLNPEAEMSAYLPSDDEKEADRLRQLYVQQEAGYNLQQATRPQTLGYGLADSPVGQLAWIYEKLHAWTDRGRDEQADVESILSRDDILDNVMLYWLTNTATSSARFYWENGRPTQAYAIDVPVCVSLFRHSPINERCPRRWAERYFSKLSYWHEVEPGGHFAAWEQPELFVDELRAAFRPFRSGAGKGAAK